MDNVPRYKEYLEYSKGWDGAAQESCQKESVRTGEISSLATACNNGSLKEDKALIWRSKNTSMWSLNLT